MNKPKDRTGQVFGRLTALQFVRMGKRGAIWEWQCTCGNTKEISAHSVVTGRTVSCGCYNKEIISTHNLSQTRIYEIWQGMLKRCYSPKAESYKYYGAKGITVCDRWKESVENFLEDMGHPPEDMSIDRKKNDQPYCKDNCKWSTRKEQNTNTSYNIIYEYNGVSKCLDLWAKEYNIPYHTLYARVVRYGWDFEKAITQKVREVIK